jgi:hypothetical protein
MAAGGTTPAIAGPAVIISGISAVGRERRE